MGKRKGKSAKKNKHRQQGRTQQGREQLLQQPEHRELQTQGTMSDEWRVFYSAVSQAVKED